MTFNHNCFDWEVKVKFWNFSETIKQKRDPILDSLLLIMFFLKWKVFFKQLQNLSVQPTLSTERNMFQALVIQLIFYFKNAALFMAHLSMKKTKMKKKKWGTLKFSGKTKYITANLGLLFCSAHQLKKITLTQYLE